MKLEFDNIGELEQFLMFSAHVGRAFQPMPPVEPEETGAGNAQHDHAQGGDRDVSNSDRALADGSEYLQAAEEATATAATDKPKRTRRTKAEIEAERAGNAQSNDNSALAEAQAEAAGVADAAPSPQGNPFAGGNVAPAMQAILDAPNQVSALAAAATAVQNAETAPGVAVDVMARALEIGADASAVESIAHLRACQGFIQKHGMPKYNESFTHGLSPNIAAYQPEQRALHLAVLESLDV